LKFLCGLSSTKHAKLYMLLSGHPFHTVPLFRLSIASAADESTQPTQEPLPKERLHSAAVLLPVQSCAQCHPTRGCAVLKLARIMACAYAHTGVLGPTPTCSLNCMETRVSLDRPGWIRRRIILNETKQTSFR